jgi:CIC family chloride channel protein
MRTDPATADQTITISALRALYPLGSRQRVALIDSERRLFGVVLLADAYTEGRDPNSPAAAIADQTAGALTPDMSIKDAMATFDMTERDTLAVVDSIENRRLVGLLKESTATRRYAEEMEKAQDLAL